MSNPIRQMDRKIKSPFYGRSCVYPDHILLNKPPPEAHLAVIQKKSFNIQDFWKLIEEQISNFKPSINNQTHTTPKAIRIFVSSTFTDFFNEREILIKQVFPELKEWCSQFGLDLVECDLRWGVPLDYTNESTILTCLEELDRCRVENGENIFFICMISERYGWIPDYETLNKQIIEKYEWIPHASITFMEIMHGAIRSRNKNACFFIRTSESLKNIPKEYQNKFFDDEEIAKEQIKEVKTRIKRYFPKQTFEYSCKFDSIDESTGRQKVKLSDFKDFSVQVLKFFKNAIETTYPHKKKQTISTSLDMTRQKYLFDSEKLEMMHHQQQLYITEKTYFYVDRSELNHILNMIRNENGQKSLNGKYLLITGNEGCGKATLLSQLCKQLESDMSVSVFYHFFNASIDSSSNESMAQRFVKKFSIELGELQSYSTFTTSECKTNLANERKKKMIERMKEMKFVSFTISSSHVRHCPNFFGEFNSLYNEGDKLNIMKDLLNKASEQKRKFIIILDGYDKRSLDTNNQNLLYFPIEIPVNVICLVSCDCEIQNMIESLQSALCSENLSIMKISFFSYEKSCVFVKNYFDKFNKKLDEKQMSLLLNEPNKEYSPLWLNFACHELKIFGEFATLNKKIESLPNDLLGLVKHILHRVNKEIGNDLLLKILCLLKTSEIGLPENEITKIIQHSLKMKEFCLLTWSQISRNLKPFLSNMPHQNIQLISLAHNSISKVVDELANDSDRDFHAALGDYFERHSKNRKYACYRVCYHLFKIGDKKRLIAFLKTKECMCLMQYHERARIFQRMRCKMIANQADPCYQLVMCGMCATRVGQLSWNSANKTSCFVCGAFVYAHSSSKAFSCLKHYDFKLNNSFHTTCIFCKMIINSNSPLKPTAASLCHMCNIGGYCHYLET